MALCCARRRPAHLSSFISSGGGDALPQYEWLCYCSYYDYSSAAAATIAVTTVTISTTTNAITTNNTTTIIIHSFEQREANVIHEELFKENRSLSFGCSRVAVKGLGDVK